MSERKRGAQTTQAEKDALAFVEADTKAKAKQLCKVCQSIAGREEINDLLRAWLRLYDEGKHGQSSWHSLCAHIEEKYGITHMAATWARHAKRCLGLTPPISG